MNTHPHSEPVLDPSALESIRRLEDTGFTGGLVSELIQMFLRSTPGRIDVILLAARERDFVRVRKIAHFLRSSAEGLGALRFSRVCANLEGVEKLTGLETEHWAKILQTEFDAVKIVFARHDDVDKVA